MTLTAPASRGERTKRSRGALHERLLQHRAQPQRLQLLLRRHEQSTCRREEFNVLEIGGGEGGGGGGEEGERRHT
jgi:hypothetical protein